VAVGNWCAKMRTFATVILVAVNFYSPLKYLVLAISRKAGQLVIVRPGVAHKFALKGQFLCSLGFCTKNGRGVRCTKCYRGGFPFYSPPHHLRAGTHLPARVFRHCKKEGAGCGPLHGCVEMVAVYYSLEDWGWAWPLVTLARSDQGHAPLISGDWACSAYARVPACHDAGMALPGETSFVS
jgi:hypothetical protein